METNKKKLFFNTLWWGFALWLWGYVLGLIFFAFVPENAIGWFVFPFGVLAILWVLYKKIERESFTCYVALGILWVFLAVILDYLFIVILLKAAHYYKPDVYLYYALTFILPIIVGWLKLKKKGNMFSIILLGSVLIVLVACAVWIDNRASVKDYVGKALSAKYNRQIDNFIIDVSIETKNFAKGSVRYMDEFGGGLWFAAKTDRGWELAFDGNGIMPCDVASKYHFPGDIVPQCFDAANNNLVQR